MKIEKKILVCGASIAGTAMAFWLARAGHQVVVVEKFASFRDGGQNVDIKDFAQEILKMMGIDREVDAKNTGELGLKHLNKKERTIASFPKGSVGGLTSDYEILRGDLARILYEKTQAVCEYRFGTFLRQIKEQEDGVSVTFHDDTTQDFAMVICADGIGSSTRDLAMPEYIHFNYLGAYMSFFTIPQNAEDDHWAKAYQIQGGGLAFLRPGHEHETTVLISFRKEKADASLLTMSQQKKNLKDFLTGKGGIADRVARELDQVKDMYFGPMSQVKASRWFKGNIVLVGDSAHAPTPFTGMGTALSLMGAYILAGELNKNTSIQAAFLEYERIFKPFVDASQAQMTPRLMRLLHPASRLGVSINRLTMQVLSSRLVQKLLKKGNKKAGNRKDSVFTLPVYEAL